MKSNTEITASGDETAADSPEVVALKAQIAAAEEKMLWAGLPTTPEFDALVALKQKMGLLRSDAVICARRQVLTDAVIKEHEAVVAEAIAKVDKQWEGKDKRLPDYREQRAAAISAAAAANGTTAKLIAAGSHMIEAPTN
jgi:hypothetical protein